MTKKSALLNKAAVFVAISLAVFFVLTFAAYLLGINARQISEAGESLGSVRYVLMTFRLSLILAAWYFWEYIVVKLLPESLSDHEERREALRTKRNRVATFFVCIEIFLAQNLLGYLLGGIV